MEGRGGEQSMHAGLCLQTLQDNAGCLGQEAFLENFNSSESISASKLKASDGKRFPVAGLQLARGKGQGPRGQCSDDCWQGEKFLLHC